MICHVGFLQHAWCLENPQNKYAPDLQWPVLTRKSLAGFTRKLTLDPGDRRSR
jgi:hypothetical protein